MPGHDEARRLDSDAKGNHYTFVPNGKANDPGTTNAPTTPKGKATPATFEGTLLSETSENHRTKEKARTAAAAAAYLSIRPCKIKKCCQTDPQVKTMSKPQKPDFGAGGPPAVHSLLDFIWGLQKERVLVTRTFV